MTRLEPILLDRDAEVPLGTQLTWALRARITGGTLPRGERLPGARELAAEVGVNVNTVRAVYARLEEEGLLAIVHGRGTFVADRAAPPDEAARLAAAVEHEARRRGIDPRAVAAALYVGPSEHEPAPAVDLPALDEPARSPRRPPADDAAIRRALRAEITRLEQRLATLPALGPGDDPLARPARRLEEGAGRLLTRQELEAARDRLAAQVAEAAAAGTDASEGSAEESAQAAAPGQQRVGRGAHEPSPSTRTRRGTLRWVTG